MQMFTKGHCCRESWDRLYRSCASCLSACLPHQLPQMQTQGLSTSAAMSGHRSRRPLPKVYPPPLMFQESFKPMFARPL